MRNIYLTCVVFSLSASWLMVSPHFSPSSPVLAVMVSLRLAVFALALSLDSWAAFWAWVGWGRVRTGEDG